jgi:ketosteroid isomerase-like protein
MTRLVLNHADDYVDFVERLYFGAVRAADVAGVLSLFAPEAVLTGDRGDAPARVLRLEPRAGEESLEAFMAAGRDFELSYQDFLHVVDCAACRIASRFTLLMVPRAGGAQAHMPARRMHNCNFFQFRDGQLIDVVAYFCNPGQAAP